MQLERQSSIYGSYPYNKLGILPNAENLRLENMSPIRLYSVEDTIDYPMPSSSSAPPVSPASPAPATTVGISPIDRLFGLVKDNTNSMVNLIIVGIVLVAENLVKGNLFTCPCEKGQNTLYGVLFLAAPAAALFVVGVMANNTTWLLTTGCFNRQKTDYPKKHHSSCYHILGVITKAFVAPLAWVIISFIDGKFYTCAASSDPCGDSEKSFLHSKSQVIGYVILMIAMFTAICGMLLWRAARPMSYEQDHYINIYRTMERLEIHKQFEAHAQGVARQNVRAFLAKESRDKKDWDYISNVPSLTPIGGPGGLHGEPPSMSPLNKLVQKERRESIDSTAKAMSAREHRAVQTQESGEYVPLGELSGDFEAL